MVLFLWTILYSITPTAPNCTIQWIYSYCQKVSNSMRKTFIYMLRQGIRSMTRFCSKIGWKWKWSEKCRKSEISLIWCISTTNNVKSCKKFNETAQTANFTDFPLSSCEYRQKWTKTMQTQTRRVRLQIFLRGIQTCHMKADVLAIPKLWLVVIL